MNRLHLSLLVSGVAGTALLWTFAMVDQAISPSDGVPSIAQPTPPRVEARQSSGKSSHDAVWPIRAEARYPADISRPLARAIGLGAPPSANARPGIEPPETFPLNEWQWRDADPDEAGLALDLVEPAIADPAPFADPWGGRWSDQGGGD